MVSEKDTRECLQLHERELEKDRVTCGRAALGGGGGGGGGARGGGGGGGGGTGMPRPQIPAEDRTNTHYCCFRSCYCAKGHFHDLLPSSLNRKSFHHRRHKTGSSERSILPGEI